MIATILVCFAVAVTTLGTSASISADLIWRDGSAELATYATTSRGDSKSYESHIVILKDPGSTDEPGSDFHVVKHVWMTLSNDEKSKADTVQVMFQKADLRPMAVWNRGSGRRSVAKKTDEVFYDGLPAWLRGFDLTEPAKFSVLLLPTLLSGDSTTTGTTLADIEIVGPAGPPSVSSHGGLQVNVRYGESVDRLWFHPGPGHILLVWEKANGTTLTLSTVR